MNILTGHSRANELSAWTACQPLELREPKRLYDASIRTTVFVGGHMKRTVWIHSPSGLSVSAR